MFDPFALWVESINCQEPEWVAIRDALWPMPHDRALEVDAAAWLAWPGRAAWLAAHPGGQLVRR